MSDFVDGFWSIYVGLMTLISVIGCGVFLWLQGRAKHSAGQTMGHVWDETLAEYNNPMPNWWRWLFYLTVIFSLFYLALYPGLGSYVGKFGWSSAGQYTREIADADAEYGKLYVAYLKQDVATVAADAKARHMGEHLFVTYCAQCHGSDARGARGYPNLTDSDWLWGGTPEIIKTTIMEGRTAVMPPFPQMGTDSITDVAHYVRSLSSLPSDPERVSRGKTVFATAGCAACHGVDATGNAAIGAPNLADKVWLFGGDEKTIIETVTKGRKSEMPAHKDFLGEAKVHVLAAYVYSLSAGKPGGTAAAK